MQTNRPAAKQRTPPRGPAPPSPPELYQVVIECCDEAQQRELFERLRQEGLKVRLLVL
jgi:hypothetical protein